MRPDPSPRVRSFLLVLISGLQNTSPPNVQRGVGSGRPPHPGRDQNPDHHSTEGQNSVLNRVTSRGQCHLVVLISGLQNTSPPNVPICVRTQDPSKTPPNSRVGDLVDCQNTFNPMTNQSTLPTKSVIRRINKSYLKDGTRFYFYFSNPDLTPDLFGVSDDHTESVITDYQKKYDLPNNLVEDLHQRLEDTNNIVVISIVTGRWGLMTYSLPESKGFKN